jgi:hypothetical protein
MKHDHIRAVKEDGSGMACYQCHSVEFRRSVAAEMTSQNSFEVTFPSAVLTVENASSFLSTSL